eukprot:TRINITY_DN2204_c0_g12_i2.p1 TRINITY_DN2204_c0_g12~~TRINITY_DN2204_c0_g12_i2.p1  ORF type:complete len:1012 (+),score=202.09 TRINITY_DN2204_c0_g12_i2:58-3036(+)
MARTRVVLLLLCLFWFSCVWQVRGKDLQEAENDAVELLEVDEATEESSDSELEWSEEQLQEELQRKAEGLIKQLKIIEEEDTKKPTEAPLIKVRIQLPAISDEYALCLSRRDFPSQHLGADRCQYDYAQFFLYSRTNKTLQPFSQKGYWVPVFEVPDDLKTFLDGKIAFVVRPEPGNYKWNLQSSQTTYMQISNDQSGLCLQSIEEGKSAIVYGIQTQNNDLSNCGVFSILLPADDEVHGIISRLRMTVDATNTPQIVQDCVTYDKHAGSQSVLYMAPCDQARTDQRFRYSLLTHHLRTYSGNGLFFWWRGPVKSYPDMSSEEQGYGWKISIRHAGPVLVDDSRGYSGVCWSTKADGRVVVEQICETFTMLPVRKNLLIADRESMHRKTTAVVVTIPPTTPTDPVMCVTMQRNPQLQTGLSGVPLWSPLVKPCDFTTYRIEQRFVLTLDSDDSQCKGHLRWAGDLRRVMLLPASDHSQDVLMVGGMTTVPITFDFPIDRVDKIVTQTGTVQGCYKVLKHSRLGDHLAIGPQNAGSPCVNFNVKLASTVPPDSNDDANVTVIERYDARANVAMPSFATSDTNLLPRSKKLMGIRVFPGDVRNNLTRFFDFFHADLGTSGARRFRPIGFGLDPRPTGDIAANKGAPINGLVFPLRPTDLMDYPYITIDVYFTAMADRAALPSDKHGHFLLMSFARASGCVVFVSSNGLPGVRCMAKGAECLFAQVASSSSINLLDGKMHKVSLIFTHSTVPLSISLYVDGAKVLSAQSSATLSLVNSALGLNLFYDPYFWQYRPLSALMFRLSVVGDDEIAEIERVAKRLGFASVKPLSVATIQTVPAIKTNWTDCKLLKGTNGLYTGMRCTLVPLLDNQPVSVPIQAFSLSCSRAKCSIAFDANQPQLSSAYTFTYRPNFPSNFTSENVGSPSLFQDPSYVTDGFTTTTVSFGLQYAPDPAVAGGASKLEVADVTGYRCMQCCCAHLLGGFTQLVQEVIDGLF